MQWETGRTGHWSGCSHPTWESGNNDDKRKDMLFPGGGKSSEGSKQGTIPWRITGGPF